MIEQVCFKAGRLAYFSEKWRKLTSDVNVLDIALHCHIDFSDCSFIEGIY